MASAAYEKLRNFFEVNEITKQVVAPLKEGATAEVVFEDDDTVYTLVKEGGRSVFKEGKPEKPEVFMKFNQGAIDYVCDFQSDNVRDYAERLSECILNPTPERKVEFKLLTSILDAGRKGYFRMVALGGPKALKTLIYLGIRVPERFLK